jgi:hypothetical protein
MLDAEDGNRTDDAARRDTRNGLGDHVLPTDPTEFTSSRALGWRNRLSEVCA